MKKLKFDSYDGVCFLNGLVFFAPVALLVRTQAGVSEHIFFLLQALLSGVIFLGEIPDLGTGVTVWREKFIACSLCEPVACTVRRGGSCGGDCDVLYFRNGKRVPVRSVWRKRISCKNGTRRKFRNSRFYHQYGRVCRDL